MDRAKALQDELRKSDLTRDHLQNLAAILQQGTRSCLRPMSAADTVFLTGLQVEVGDRYLAMHDYTLASEALGTADAMFERSNLPDDVWLHSLESAAYAEIFGSHDLPRALEIASEQVTLARSWVNMGLDKRFELSRALRFQAYVLTLKNEPARAAEVSKEADSLESGISPPVRAQADPSCEAAAEKWFKEHFPQPNEHAKVGWGKAAYASHFSAEKDGCFMEVVAITHIERNVVTAAADSEMHHLVDLNVGQEIGRLVIVSNTTAPVTICELGNTKCLSAPDWYALIGPYMRD
jgi:hypothetical protein